VVLPWYYRGNKPEGRVRAGAGLGFRVQFGHMVLLGIKRKGPLECAILAHNLADQPAVFGCSPATAARKTLAFMAQQQREVDWPGGNTPTTQAVTRQIGADPAPPCMWLALCAPTPWFCALLRLMRDFFMLIRDSSIAVLSRPC